MSGCGHADAHSASLNSGSAVGRGVIPPNKYLVYQVLFAATADAVPLLLEKHMLKPPVVYAKRPICAPTLQSDTWYTKYFSDGDQASRSSSRLRSRSSGCGRGLRSRASSQPAGATRRAARKLLARGASRKKALGDAAQGAAVPARCAPASWPAGVREMSLAQSRRARLETTTIAPTITNAAIQKPRYPQRQPSSGRYWKFMP